MNLHKLDPNHNGSKFSKAIGLLLFITAFICFQTLSFGQVSIDSLRAIWMNQNQPDSSRFNAFNTFYVHYTSAQPDLALKVSSEHYQLASNKGYPDQLIKVLNEKAIIHFFLGNPDSSMTYIEQAIEIGERTQDTLTIAKLYVNHGNALRAKGHLREAVKRYTQTIHLLESSGGEEKYLADLYNNIGLIYLDINLHTLSLEYLYKALELYKIAKEEDAIGNIWLNIGANKYHLGEYRNAIDLIKKGFVILDSEKNLFSLSDCHQFLALSYSKIGQQDSALWHIDEAISMKRQLQNNGRLLDGLIIKGNLLINENLPNTLHIVEEIKLLMIEESSVDLLASGSRLLYELYKKQGNTELALSMLEKFTEYNDSIKIQMNEIAVIKEAIQSDFDNKLIQEQLKSEKEQAALKIGQLKRIYSLVILGLILLILAFVIYRRLIQKYQIQKKQLLDEIEQLKRTKGTDITIDQGTFSLKRSRLELHIGKNLNETDWSVLNFLLKDPGISNKDLAKQVFLSVDGVGSSLRRMYELFNIKESKYMKITLLMEAIKLSKTDA
jgi:tetratricopeptide (TPR) repeat protein